MLKQCLCSNFLTKSFDSFQKIFKYPVPPRARPQKVFYPQTKILAKILPRPSKCLVRLDVLVLDLLRLYLLVYSFLLCNEFQQFDIRFPRQCTRCSLPTSARELHWACCSDLQRDWLLCRLWGANIFLSVENSKCGALDSICDTYRCLICILYLSHQFSKLSASSSELLQVLHMRCCPHDFRYFIPHLFIGIFQNYKNYTFSIDFQLHPHFQPISRGHQC